MMPTAPAVSPARRCSMVFRILSSRWFATSRSFCNDGLDRGVPGRLLEAGVGLRQVCHRLIVGLQIRFFAGQQISSLTGFRVLQRRKESVQFLSISIERRIGAPLACSAMNQFTHAQRRTSTAKPTRSALTFDRKSEGRTVFTGRERGDTECV